VRPSTPTLGLARCSIYAPSPNLRQQDAVRGCRDSTASSSTARTRRPRNDALPSITRSVRRLSFGCPCLILPLLHPDRVETPQSSPHLSLPSFPPPPERLCAGVGREVEAGIVHRPLTLPPLAMTVHIPRSGRDVLTAPIQHAPQSPQAAAGKRHVDAVRELRFSCPLAGHVVCGGGHQWGRGLDPRRGLDQCPDQAQ